MTNLNEQRLSNKFGLGNPGFPDRPREEISKIIQIIPILNKLGVTPDHFQTHNRSKSIDLYMKIARAMSEHTHDAETGHGCVAVKNNRIIAAGVNGFPSGAIDEILPNIRKDGHKYYGVNHSEMNMIYDAAKRGISLDGARIYVTGYPCQACSKALVSVGITDWVVGNKKFNETGYDAGWRELWVKMFDVNITEYNA